MLVRHAVIALGTIVGGYFGHGWYKYHSCYWGKANKWDRSSLEPDVYTSQFGLECGGETRLQPWQHANEKKVFVDQLEGKASVFEAGIGGSTWMVMDHDDVTRYVGVEPMAAWIDHVRRAAPYTYEFRCPKVGEVTGAGYPVGEDNREIWPHYTESLSFEHDKPFDLYFIDGRFRVAFAARALLHGQGAPVMVHDYFRYGDALEEIADAPLPEVALCPVTRKAGHVSNAECSLRVLTRKQGVTDDQLRAFYERHKYEQP